MGDYASPIIRAREGLRRSVREILAFYAAGALLSMCIYSVISIGPFEVNALTISASLLFGVPVGIAGWIVYRVLRFACGY